MTDYLDWQSELTLETVFAGTESVSYPQLIGNGIVYLSSLPDDQGRVVLKYKELGKPDAGEGVCITPQPFHLRTKISEYGGKPFWLHGNTLYFANQADQCLYKQILGSNIFGSSALNNGEVSQPSLVNVKLEGADLCMYTDVIEIEESRLIAIAEFEFSQADTKRENQTAVVFFEDNAVSEPQTIEILSSGADFYSNLVYHPDTKKLAWVQWNHPNMPWDETELWVADLLTDDRNYRIQNAQKIDISQEPSAQGDKEPSAQGNKEPSAQGNKELSAQGNKEPSAQGNKEPLAQSNQKLSAQGNQKPLDNSCPSICQLCFANNGKLFFSADFANQANNSMHNYWNIYAIDFSLMADEFESLQIIPVSNCLAKDGEFFEGLQAIEFGYPHWQYGDVRIVQLDAISLLAIGSSPEGDLLLKIDQESLEIRLLADGTKFYQHLSSDGEGRVASIMLSAQLPPALALLEPAGIGFEYAQPMRSSLSEANLSTPEHIKFPTRDKETAFAFYYPPINSKFTGPAERLPPLIVMVHGGPTARAYGFFDIQKQYWTQRGFAILDVNHRGSSGYGRAYRDALYGRWGEVDTSDIVDGIDYLIKRGKVDASRVCIRGKSAGGYAVLAALTQYPEVFCVGACYYGIGNLLTLAATTHKFEKYYTDHLIGETYDPMLSVTADSLFTKRSPINKLAELQSSMIIFQGSQDKVVPPAVAHEIVNVLGELGLNHIYVEYPEEGHGFRQLKNNIDSLTQELEFYRANLERELD